MTHAIAAHPQLVALRRSLADGRVQVALLIVIALVARVLFLALSGSFGRVINNDAADYLVIARNLAAGQGFAFAAGEPTAFRPFGYPVFLALLALLGDPIIWVHLSQALVGSLAVWPAYLIARRFTTGPLPLLVAAGVAVHPVLIYLTALIAPETIALLAQLVVICLALRIAGAGRRWLEVLLMALAGAVAVLMRPELLLLLCLLPAAVVWRRLAGRPVQHGGAIAAACLLAAAVALAPLAVRNQRVLGHASPMPTIGGVTFWGANNAAARGGWLLPAPELWPGADPPASMRGWPELDEYASQARFYRASLDWMAANPARALALLPRKLFRGWSLSYADEARASDVPAAASAANWAFGALALLGIVVSVRSGTDGYWVLYAALLAWLFKTLVFYGSARQTALAVPIFLVFAGVALEWLGRRWRGRPG